MTARSDFTDAEWSTLVEVPVLAMLCASLADDDSRLGYLREVAAGSEAITRAVEKYPDNELIAAIAWAMEDEATGQAFATAMRGLSAEQMTERLFEQCQQAMALLAEKAEPAEMSAYATWILDIAAEVALATSKGGILGIGGEPITREERAFLQRLADALTAIARVDGPSPSAASQPPSEQPG
ncbi:MAG: hypothetical protein KatS3mg059_0446 [Thermomicrobiales bacterium]|nr:MAG: hypothetical protein KatS3mg059_0446 [Thermomicrobiales bacterium]